MSLPIESDMGPKGIIDPEGMVSTQYRETVAIELSRRPLINLEGVANRLVYMDGLFLLVLPLGVRVGGFEDFLDCKVDPLRV